MQPADIWDYITDNQDTNFDQMSEVTNIAEDKLKLLCLLHATNDKERFDKVINKLPKNKKFNYEGNFTGCIR